MFLRLHAERLKVEANRSDGKKEAVLGHGDCDAYYGCQSQDGGDAYF